MKRISMRLIELLKGDPILCSLSECNPLDELENCYCDEFKWIDLRKQVPPFRLKVLTNHGRIYLFTDQGEFRDIQSGYSITGVTHWMKVPRYEN